MLYIQIYSLLSYTFINAIPIDNGVEGDPEIDCGPTAITVNFNTRNNFEGHVYAKGLYSNQDCRSDEGGRQVASLSLPFGSCNVVRTRSLNPRGIFVTAVVVVTFHPQFLTKIDRIYRLQCFYMEADKTVSTQIEVSEMTTSFATQLLPMPICRYEILDGGPSGQPVQYALIGQPVYHKWTCESESVNTFCALVHSCYVDNGNGDSINLIDEKGCALDRYLLNNLEYPTDLMAGQEAHVFKYADQPQLFYQCQITITIKEPNGECQRAQCSEPQGFGATEHKSRLRIRRSTNFWDNARNTLDVRTEMSALEIMEEMGDDDDVMRNLKSNQNGLRNLSLAHTTFSPARLCFTADIFIIVLIVTATLLCCISIIFIFFFQSNESKLSFY